MALETLLNVTEIDGVQVGTYTRETKELETFISVNHEENVVTFKIQNGPIKEVGVNGCQVTDMLKTVRAIYHGLNEKFPSVYNKGTLSHIDIALGFQEQRTIDREARGVEGMSLV